MLKSYPELVIVPEGDIMSLVKKFTLGAILALSLGAGSASASSLSILDSSLNPVGPNATLPGSFSLG